MLERLREAFLFRGTLGRLDFLLVWLTVAVLAIVTHHLLVSTLYVDSLRPHKAYHETSVATKLIFAAILVPLYAARLRDLKFPIWLVALPILTASIHPDLLMTLKQQLRNVSGTPFWFVGGRDLFVFAHILLLSTLFSLEAPVEGRYKSRPIAWLILVAYVATVLYVAVRGPVYELSLWHKTDFSLAAASALPFTPIFLIGAVPSLLLVLPNNASIREARNWLFASIGVFGLLCLWLAFLWFGLVYQYDVMSRVR